MQLAVSMKYLLVFLIGVQGFLMLIDELIFHRQRGLGNFERWGHVADTGVFFLALLVPALFPLEQPYGLIYLGLALASSLIITKDEAIHNRACGAAEQWCHALLFVLHGAILMTVYMLWQLAPDAGLLRTLPLAVFCWGLYQHFYWNVYERHHLGTKASHQQ